jgi:hypothetical protein
MRIKFCIANNIVEGKKSDAIFGRVNTFLMLLTRKK